MQSISSFFLGSSTTNDDKVVIRCDTPEVKKEVERLLQRSTLTVKSLGNGELFVSRIEEVKKRSICFLVSTKEDGEWINRDLQPYAGENKMDFVVSLDQFKGNKETTLFFKVHDNTGGRLAPDQLDDEMMNLVIEGAKNVIITVLVSKGAKGTSLPLTSIIRSGIGLKIREEQPFNERIINCWRTGLKQLSDPKQAWGDIAKCLERLEEM